MSGFAVAGFTSVAGPSLGAEAAEHSRRVCLSSTAGERMREHGHRVMSPPKVGKPQRRSPLNAAGSVTLLVSLVFQYLTPLRTEHAMERPQTMLGTWYPSACGAEVMASGLVL